MTAESVHDNARHLLSLTHRNLRHRLGPMSRPSYAKFIGAFSSPQRAFAALDGGDCTKSGGSA
jgi:hypothetical protein